MKYFVLIVVLFFSPSLPPALANNIADELALAKQDYSRGDFARARTTAQQLDTAEGYALACQSGLVIGGFQEQGIPAVMSLHGALADCRKALDLDPTHYRAGLSHAIALGFEGQRLRKTAYARASKKNIESLITRYPDNALALGALGGWHAAVSREGVFARLILDASRAEASTLYSKALQLPGAELPLYFEFIRFLASGNSLERAKALTVLAKVFEKPPNGALEKLLIDKSLQIKDAIEFNDKKLLKKALEEATPFNDIDVWGTVRKTGISAFPLDRKRGQL